MATSEMRSPTVRRRWVARQLKQLREQRGMTLAEVAKSLDIHASNLSRIENREAGAKPVFVRAALSLYGVTGDEAESIIDVARGAQKRGWWQNYNDVIPGWFGFYVGLEEEAQKLETYEPETVPGVFQTERYARAMFQLTAGGDDIDRKVAARLRRQDIYQRDIHTSIDAVLNEAVLLRPIGGVDIHREQLDHLLELATMPNISVRVLPFSAGGHPAMTGPFTILTFPDAVDDPVVYIDNYTTGHVLEEPKFHEWYNNAHQQLRKLSLSPARSVERIKEVSGTFD